LGAIGYPLAKNIAKQYGINGEIKDLEKEISGVESKNSELKGLIDYLGSDQFAEEQARLNLNYKKKGEEVLVIDDEKYAGDASSTGKANTSPYTISGKDKVPPPPVIGNPTRWWRYFFEQ